MTVTYACDLCSRQNLAKATPVNVNVGTALYCGSLYPTYQKVIYLHVCDQCVEKYDLMPKSDLGAVVPDPEDSPSGFLRRLFCGGKK